MVLPQTKSGSGANTSAYAVAASVAAVAAVAADPDAVEAVRHGPFYAARLRLRRDQPDSVPRAGLLLLGDPAGAQSAPLPVVLLPRLAHAAAGAPDPASDTSTSAK